MHLVRYEQNGSLCCSGCGAQGPITVIGDASHEDATRLATATWDTGTPRMTHSPDGASGGAELKADLWGLFNPDTARFRNKVFHTEAEAMRYATEKSDNYCQLIATPLFGPGALSPSPGLGEEGIPGSPSAHASPLRSAAATEAMVLAGRDALYRRRYARIKALFDKPGPRSLEVSADEMAEDARACIEAALSSEAPSPKSEETSPHDPRRHAADCSYHCDQYPWECDCGVLSSGEPTPADAPSGVISTLPPDALIPPGFDREKLITAVGEAVDYLDWAGAERAVDAVLATLIPPGFVVAPREVVEALATLRAAGWSVAVHNDYRLNGEPHTFWLFTHPDGTWIKGEGRDDAAAINEALAALPPPGGGDAEGSPT